jgi:phage FluMu protein Com
MGYHCPPNRVEEMLKAVRTTSTMRSRSMLCPYCGHKAFTVYEGTTGYVETKCNKCKHVVSFNLVSMRRVNPPA